MIPWTDFMNEGREARRQVSQTCDSGRPVKGLIVLFLGVIPWTGFMIEGREARRQVELEQVQLPCIGQDRRKTELGAFPCADSMGAQVVRDGSVPH